MKVSAADLQNWRANGARFLRWWVQELQEMGQILLERLAPRLSKRVLVGVTELSAVISTMRGKTASALCEVHVDAQGEWPLQLAESEAMAAARGARAAVALARSEVFRYVFTLPANLEQDLEPVIALRLERELPVSRNEVVVDYSIRHRLREAGQIEVALVVARRAVVDRMRLMVEGWGFRPVQIGVQTADGSLECNFLPRRFRIRDLRLGVVNRRLLMGSVGICFTLLALVAGRWTYERVTVGRELRRVDERAELARHLSRRLEAETAPARELAQLAAVPDASDVLVWMTTSVPTDSWVYDLDIAAAGPGGPRVRLSSFTPAAAKLAETLNQTHRFGKVEIVSASPAGAGLGGDRVQLSVGARSGGAL